MRLEVGIHVGLIAPGSKEKQKESSANFYLRKKHRKSRAWGYEFCHLAGLPF